MLDSLLLFPPQWSPFQPALSLPALSAWLRRAGYSVACLDLNVEFYDWLLSDSFAETMLSAVADSDLPEVERHGYAAAFRNASAFRAGVRDRLTPAPRGTWFAEDPDELAASQYMAVRTFQTYLRTVSEVCRDVVVSPYEFRLPTGNLESASIEAFIDSPPRLARTFVEHVANAQLESRPARVVGLSCIGQEQLLFTLLLGKWLKDHTDAEIAVGGTIFSRIFERGVLPAHWFGRYFDVIVRNEGERPLEALLANALAGRALCTDVSGVVQSRDGELVSSQPCPPLRVEELPVPDFDDMPLERYFSPEITLPLLSSRGCYWGKCEFCHHGMVYGEKYEAYPVGRVLDTVSEMARRYGVRHFAFNDEAIPPRVLRGIGREFPDGDASGWRFTGLIKFERSYKGDDFAALRRVGFRSLYVGLESASERVLALMEKNNTRETMVNNLRFARDNDIWLHCFIFFGFPGETAADAKQTYDFVVDNVDIISSFGTATFVLEHNAPIYHHVEDFGIRIRRRSARDMDVYYEFDSDHEIGPEQAENWRLALNAAAMKIPRYTAVGWVPRELQLCMLAEMTVDDLLATGTRVRRQPAGIPPATPIPRVLALAPGDGHHATTWAVNLLTGQVVGLSHAAAEVVALCQEHGYTTGQVMDLSILLWERLFAEGQDSGIEAVSQPVPAPA
jgi:hypothetical protein